MTQINKEKGNIYKSTVPTILTCSRMILSFCLLCIDWIKLSFFVIYILCGVTDILDGYLARKWKVSSKFGAFLDSMADLILTVILFIIFIPILDWKGWMFLWMGTIVVIRFFSVLIGAVKYHTIAWIHTNGNKMAGLLLFCFPLLLKAAGMVITFMVIGIIALFSGIEEMLIMILSDDLDRDRKGWWEIIKK